MRTLVVILFVGLLLAGAARGETWKCDSRIGTPAPRWGGPPVFQLWQIALPPCEDWHHFGASTNCEITMLAGPELCVRFRDYDAEWRSGPWSYPYVGIQPGRGEPIPVPEPSSTLMLVVGLVALTLLPRRSI